MTSGVEKLGHAATHWALGGLVLVALAAAEGSGAGTLVALPIAAMGSTFAALSGFSKPVRVGSATVTGKRKSLHDIADFLEIWLDVLEHLVAAATCARVASATVDYTSEGRLRDWLFGIDSHSLGEPWPDILGIAIIAVVTTLFMLGLEKSYPFCIILFLGLLISLSFFITVGSYHADIIFWNWAEDFKSWHWGDVLTSAALCSFGFANTIPSAFTTYKRLKVTLTVIVPLVCFTAIALVFTLMSHYREVAGTAIPLVRVFEVRDVDWARPVMATCTICVVCVSLTEIMPYLYNLIVQLAGFNWRILVSPILYKNSLTGAPVLAIFTAGSLCSILAFSCPLWYLVRLVNTAALLKCAVKSCIALYELFKPEFQHQNSIVNSTNIQYSQLNLHQTKRTGQTKSKSIYNMIPTYLKKTTENVAGNSDGRQRKSRKSPSGDKEYLLLDHYSGDKTRDSFNLIDDTGSDSDLPETGNFTDGEESSSSTDIDAVVQEYKERIQVATISNLESNKRTPTFITSRIVLSLIMLLLVTSSMLSLGICWNMPHLIWPSLIISISCLIIIITMPKRVPFEQTESAVHPVLQSLVFLLAIFINILLATTLLLDIWPALILWSLAGLILYSRCNCCNCEEDKHRHRLYTSHTECSLASVSSSRNPGNKYVEVDTIIIPR